MTRAVSYPAPFLRATRSETSTRREDVRRGTIWTDREVTFLLTNYRVIGPERCGITLRRSNQAVRLKAHRMGLAQMPSITIADIVSRLSVSAATPTEQRVAS